MLLGSLPRLPKVTSDVIQGSAVGGAIHPIMLNKWFHGSLGFQSGVRTSAGLLAGLLTISIILMKPRYPPAKTPDSMLKNFKRFLKDVPYVIMILGFVLSCNQSLGPAD